jgi:putative ABC transport system permease protein
LAARPDGVLVSAETATTYQLKSGDLVNLRLQNAKDHQYRVVPFHFVGTVREFPTAPKDSFLMANAAYIALRMGSDAVDIVLLRTSSRPTEVADRARVLLGSVPGVSVTDLGSTQHAISSSLTAVNLHGLTQLELFFAVLLVAGATGLMMALGLAERRRTFAILTALGAKERQLGAFLWSEGLMVLIGGSVIGVGLGFGVAQMLVKLLTGVFDPPPEFFPSLGATSRYSVRLRLHPRDWPSSGRSSRRAGRWWRPFGISSGRCRGDPLLNPATRSVLVRE